MSTVTIEPMQGTIGAWVRGATHEGLRNDAAVPAMILEALEQYGVLVFRELHFDDDTQVEFSNRLGKVERLGIGERPEIFIVTLDPNKNPIAPYLRGTFDWHIDGCTDDVPIMATMLAAHAVAESGGETEFASSYGAYDRLSDETKERVDGMRVVHTISATQRRIFPNPSPEQVAMWEQRPAKEHPLVWKHNSGRRSLVLGATADYIVGMSHDESQVVLDELLAHATQQDHVYRHEWLVGDVVLWDNRGVLHRALAYPEDSPRNMHRTTFTGDERIQ